MNAVAQIVIWTPEERTLMQEYIKKLRAEREAMSAAQQEEKGGKDDAYPNAVIAALDAYAAVIAKQERGAE